jgi:hypothetical protein
MKDMDGPIRRSSLRLKHKEHLSVCSTSFSSSIILREILGRLRITDLHIFIHEIKLNCCFLILQILQESIQIPGSALHLMYQSSQAPGYLSSVLMRLTHATIPPTLTHVHVRVEIEGSVHTKTYEADPHLMHKFAWNKRNVYKQKASLFYFTQNSIEPKGLLLCSQEPATGPYYPESDESANILNPSSLRSNINCESYLLNFLTLRHPLRRYIGFPWSY